MLSVAEAQALVLQHARPLSPKTLPADASLLGQVLAEEVVSDLDMPPFDKALMDGYALRAGDLADGKGTLQVVGEVTAGQTPRQSVGSGQAVRIMTGAPIPPGADAVVQVERTRLLDDGTVTVEEAGTRTPRPGHNILARAKEMRRGEAILSPGAVLRPQELGLLATVGRTSVRVYPRPTVAVLATGDELVDADRKPESGQIRNSNGPMLLAQVSRSGAVARNLGIARDRLDSLEPLVDDGLRSDVLILSGGVSAGKLDLVPGVLKSRGVQDHFHKVTMKPGKPIFFGTRQSTLVFGLPGNPVSSLACFELFVRPGLHILAGHSDPGPRKVRARLRRDYLYRTDRPTYHPARLTEGEEGWEVEPAAWFGSPDLRAVSGSNCLVVFPAGDHQHRAGQWFPVIRTGPDEI